MNVKLYCSLVSFFCFLYAKHLNHKNIEEMSGGELKKHLSEIGFYTLFGAVSLLLSFY